MEALRARLAAAEGILRKIVEHDKCKSGWYGARGHVLKQSECGAQILKDAQEFLSSAPPIEAIQQAVDALGWAERYCLKEEAERKFKPEILKEDGYETFLEYETIQKCLDALHSLKQTFKG